MNEPVVARYSPDPCEHGDLTKDPAGTFVAAADYDALLAERDKLSEALRERSVISSISRLARSIHIGFGRLYSPHANPARVQPHQMTTCADFGGMRAAVSTVQR